MDDAIGSLYQNARREIAKVIVGQDAVIEQVLLTLFAGGHVLIEGIPGTAKTLLIRVLARLFHCQFKRVQFTPDLMPADIIGTSIFDPRQQAFQFRPGPVLAQLVHGDDVRLLDWKATARRRKLIVRNQEAERNQTVLILVDSGRLMNAEVEGVAKLDHAVNTALLLAHVALARGDRVGLCTFSHKVHAWVAPRAHLAQIRLITDTLYDLRGDFTETDHGRCLRLLSARHPERALLVVLTDFVDAQTAAEMIVHLQLASRRHLVLFAALKDPFLERAARSHPDNTLEGFRKAAALELLHERLEVLERLRQMARAALDVEPAGVMPPVLNQYLEITFRGLL